MTATERSPPSPVSPTRVDLLCYANVPVKPHMTICKSAEEACANAEAIVINTEWDEFKNLDWQKSEL